MRIGEKIQILRKQNDISQEQLAEKLSISRQAISKWETGECLPDIENIVRLSSLFDVSTDYLLKAYHSEAPMADHAPTSAEFDAESIEDDDNTGYNITLSFGGVVYPIALLVFMVLRFIEPWQMRQAWVVFPIAWVIETIISYIKTGRFGTTSIYSVAAVVFLIMGFGWSLWHPGWIVFVAAWVLKEVVNVAMPRRKKWDNDEYTDWRQQ